MRCSHSDHVVLGKTPPHVWIYVSTSQFEAGAPAEHQDFGASFPSLWTHLDSVKTQLPSRLAFLGALRALCLEELHGMAWWHGVPLSLPRGGSMSVQDLNSSIWELMLAERLEPRILGSWVPVRVRRTVRAEVSGPASVTGASLRQPSPKTSCGLTRRGSLCHRGWGNCSEDKSRL